MPAAISVRTDFSASELRRLAAATKHANQSRRLLSIAAVLDGMNRTEAARIGGMDRQTLRDWVHRFNEHGPDGLKDAWSKGNPPRLSLDQLRGRGGRPEVYSTGLRNPQGFDWQPGTGRLVGNDHGPDGDDEINVLRRGANLGWPRIRGEARAPGLETPIQVYPESIAPSGATFVRRPGSTWSGDYLIGALVGEQVRRVSIDRTGTVRRDEALFEGRLGRVRTVVEGPDGALYLLTNNRDGRGTPSEGDDRIIRVVPPAG
jgi:glucose/arabinose dehydrogenase